MVSQPDHSLTLRGPSSVSSARTSRLAPSSRSKRYNRSHAGGTTYIPQNEFPIFSNSGDVEILVQAGGRENRYLLHRHTLVRCSGFFEASTSQEWSKATNVLPLPQPEDNSNELARIGEESSSGREVGRLNAPLSASRKRWRYELDLGSGTDDIPMLVQKEDNAQMTSMGSLFGSGGSSSNSSQGPIVTNKPSSRHRSDSSPSHANHSFFRSVANLSLSHSHSHSQSNPTPQLSQADADLLRDYDNLFRIFYNYPPILDGFNIADAYVQCKSLLTLADQYDALPVAGPRVDHHLLQFQSKLWKQIAKYPVSYLRLGYLARSRIIFQEALIHVVGQWPSGERAIRQQLPELVLDIIEDKVDELEEIISRIEGRLFRLSLTNSRGERVTPGGSYLDWLAMSLFRQWLADNTSPAPPPPLERDRRHGSSRDAGLAHAPHTAIVPKMPSLASIGRTYRLLGSANSSGYLGHDECKRFLKLTPELYSRDNLRRFEKRVGELKDAARELVRPLMGSGLELDTGSTPARSGDLVGYLTCVQVVDRDLPWATDD